jgi:hypothetical protein
MSLPMPGRVERRRAVHRRRLMLGAGGVGAAVVLAALVVVLSGGADEEPKRASSTKRSTTTSSSTTTTTAPVPTTVVPQSSNPVVALAQQYDGYYEGTFTNTTFGTDGKTTLLLRVDPVANTIEATSDFDGDVFGGGAKEIRQIKATIPLGDPTGAIATETKAFGQVTGHIDPDVTLVLTAPDVPGAAVASFELRGNLRADLTGFDASYHVVFADGSTADGVITVLCSANRQRPSEVQTLCTPQ